MTCKCERKSESNWTDCKNEAKSSTPGVLRARLLRLLGMNRDFKRSLSIQEDICNVGFTAGDYGYDKEINTVLLEAERKKAEALTEWQKHRLIC